MASKALNRNPSEKEAQRIEIARMYRAGKSQNEIAAALGISQPTVSRDLRVMLKRWQKRADGIIETAQGELLEKILYLYGEALAGWEKSQKTAITAKGVVVGDLPGDAAFLGQAMAALKQQMKLLGVGDRNLPIKPETMLLLAAMGINLSDVSKQFNDMVALAAKEKEEAVNK